MLGVPDSTPSVNGMDGICATACGAGEGAEEWLRRESDSRLYCPRCPAVEIGEDRRV